jgi:hypothetical protein
LGDIFKRAIRTGSGKAVLIMRCEVRVRVHIRVGALVSHDLWAVIMNMTMTHDHITAATATPVRWGKQSRLGQGKGLVFF